MSESHVYVYLWGENLDMGDIFFSSPQPTEKILYYYFFSLSPPIVYLKQT